MQQRWQFVITALILPVAWAVALADRNPDRQGEDVPDHASSSIPAPFFTFIDRSTTPLEIYFSSSASRNYRVEIAESNSNGTTWTTFTNIVPGQASETMFLDGDMFTNRFYRVWSIEPVTSNETLSMNAAFVQKRDLSDKTDLRSLPYLDLEVFGQPVSNVYNSVPGGSTLTVYDRVLQIYLTGRGGIWNNGTNDLNRAESHFIYTPGPHIQTYAGEVPDRLKAPTSIVEVLPGLNLMANPYPVATSFTNMEYADSLAPFSVVMTWDPESERLTRTIKGPPVKPGWGSESIPIGIGQGFWIRSKGSNSSSIHMEKPYAWP